MGDLTITYVDTNVFLAYTIGKDKEQKKYPLAKDFLEGLESRNEEAVISFLTLTEILSVIRKDRSREFETLTSLGTEQERCNHIIDGAKTIYYQLLSVMLKIPNIKFMPKKDLDINLLFSSAFTMLESTRGKVDFHHFCKNCGNEKNDKFFSGLKCVGAVDLIHLLIAKELSCDKLVTFDQGFTELINHEKILPMTIDVLIP